MWSIMTFDHDLSKTHTFKTFQKNSPGGKVHYAESTEQFKSKKKHFHVFCLIIKGIICAWKSVIALRIFETSKLHTIAYVHSVFLKSCQTKRKGPSVGTGKDSTVNTNTLNIRERKLLWPIVCMVSADGRKTHYEHTCSTVDVDTGTQWC
jgi:hypothetical protein